MSTATSWVLARRRRLAVGCVFVLTGAFAAAVPEAPAAAVASAPSSTTVRNVQLRLAALRFLPSSQVDGKLGPRTKHAITAFQQWRGIAPDGIAGPQTLAELRAAAPPTAGKTGASRRIEIYRARGITFLIDHGKVSRVVHSSAGKRGYETPTGRYRIVRKVLMDWSRAYKSWMPYASYFIGGYALHEGSVPTHPVSHGCVRLPAGDAADVYRFATVGTAVIVYR